MTNRISIIRGIVVLLSFSFIILITGIFISKRNQFTEVTLLNELKDLGIINLHDLPKIDYLIINEGNNDLLISEVTPDCYCTVVSDWPKDRIIPGDTARIELIYTPNIADYFLHTAKVKLNTKEQSLVLVFRGKVTK